METSNEIRLLRIPEMASLSANRKTLALALIHRGADAALLLFWFNLITGAYSHFPIHCVMNDVMHYIERYPEFENDITLWFQTFETLTHKK